MSQSPKASETPQPKPLMKDDPDAALKKGLSDNAKGLIGKLALGA